MQNFVVDRFLGAVTEMHLNFVGSGTDTAVNGGGFRLCWLNDSYCVPSFLAVGRNPWYDVGAVPGRQKASLRLRNVVYNRKLA